MKYIRQTLLLNTVVWQRVGGGIWWLTTKLGYASITLIGNNVIIECGGPKGMTFNNILYVMFIWDSISLMSLCVSFRL